MLLDWRNLIFDAILANRSNRPFAFPLINCAASSEICRTLYLTMVIRWHRNRILLTRKIRYNLDVAKTPLDSRTNFEHPGLLPD